MHTSYNDETHTYSSNIKVKFGITNYKVMFFLSKFSEI